MRTILADRNAIKQAKRGDFTTSCEPQPPPENMWPNEPKPPRVTWEEATAIPAELLPDEEEPPKKLQRERL